MSREGCDFSWDTFFQLQLMESHGKIKFSKQSVATEFAQHIIDCWYRVSWTLYNCIGHSHIHTYPDVPILFRNDDNQADTRCWTFHSLNDVHIFQFCRLFLYFAAKIVWDTSAWLSYKLCIRIEMQFKGMICQFSNFISKTHPLQDLLQIQVLRLQVLQAALLFFFPLWVCLCLKSPEIQHLTNVCLQAPPLTRTLLRLGLCSL